MTFHYGLHNPTGLPDMQLGSLAIWVRGRQFSDSQDYRDGNWLSALVQVDAAYAVVQAEGPVLHAGELSDFVEGCKRLHGALTGELVLGGAESNFHITLAINARGQLDVGLDLTGDPLAQRHHFDFALDQSYLPAFIDGGEDILRRFPVRGSRDMSGRSPTT
jgi:hypothetical protein